MQDTNIIIKEVKKKLLSIMLLTKKFYKKIQEMSIEACQKRKKGKTRRYQREKCHMNTDLNEKLKQYQRNYYSSNKNG